jgi:NADH-quinone oxidoreductase subunit N
MFQSSTTDELLWLVGLAVLNSFISLYYYLMVMRQMYMFDPQPGRTRFRANPLLVGLAFVLMMGTVAIGVYPGPLLKGADEATETLFLTAEDAAALTVDEGPVRVEQPK